MIQHTLSEDVGGENIETTEQVSKEAPDNSSPRVESVQTKRNVSVAGSGNLKRKSTSGDDIPVRKTVGKLRNESSNRKKMAPSRKPPAKVRSESRKRKKVHL